jgi:hypothetical protein
MNDYIAKDQVNFKRGGQLLDVIYKACQNAACIELKSIMDDIF